MNTIIFDEWFHDLMNRKSEEWRETISVTGSCRKHLGPRTLFAVVSLDFLPTEQFEINSTLDPAIAKHIQEQGWYQYIIFGILDVMLTTKITPIRNFKIVIREVDFNEIETNQIAFRLAARDAAFRALATQYPNLPDK